MNRSINPNQIMLAGPTFFYFGKDCPLSHFYNSPFVVKGHEFANVECFLMYNKASFFGDTEVALKISQTRDPAEAKRLGRSVANFDNMVWLARRHVVAFVGNVAKYEQNPRAKDFLISTVLRELVEASPYDGDWGTGIGINDPRIQDRNNWGGNLHGKVQMRVRHYFNEGVVPPGVDLSVWK